MAETGGMTRLFRDYGLTILLAVVSALLIRYYVIEAYRIPAGTMQPTLESGDTIFVAKWPYRLAGHSPTRGEVIVYAADNGDRARVDSVKRVIGLPGDRVQIRNGRVVLNAQELAIAIDASGYCGKEKLPDAPEHGVCLAAPFMEDEPEQVVPQGSVFAISDLRSKPSALGVRPWAFAPFDSVKGIARWVWLSIEPQGSGPFPKLRFERMLRRIQ